VLDVLQSSLEGPDSRSDLLSNVGEPPSLLPGQHVSKLGLREVDGERFNGDALIQKGLKLD